MLSIFSYFLVNLGIWVMSWPFLCLCFSGFQAHGPSSPVMES